MNKNTIFNFAFFAIIISLIACNNSQETKSSSHSNLDPEDIPENCNVPITGYEKSLPYRLDNSCAIAALNEYQDSIDSVLEHRPSKDSTIFVRGAKVNLYELRSILAHHLEHNTGYDSLYVMLGIIDGDTHVIFALQDTVEVPYPNPDPTRNTPSVGTQYFNFTYPCPSACPETFNNKAL